MTPVEFGVTALFAVSILAAIYGCFKTESRFNLVLSLDFIGFACLAILIFLAGVLKQEALYDVAILLSGIGFFAAWVCSKHISSDKEE